MICKYLEGFVEAKEVRTPFSQAMHDCEKLFVMDLIVEFGCLKFPRLECYGMESRRLRRRKLRDYSSDCIVTGISFDDRFRGCIEVSKDWRRGEG